MHLQSPNSPFCLPSPIRPDCLPDVHSEADSRTNERALLPLSALLSSGPIAYDQFLNLAVPLAEAVRRLHSAGTLHGQLSPDSVMYDGAHHVVLTPPPSGSATLDDDLRALGRIFYLALTGKPVTETRDANLLKRIYPVEAKLTVEKLLGIHPSGQFAGATELHASLVLMRDVYELSANNRSSGRRTGSARVYLSLSLIALILLLLWIALAIIKR